MKKISSQFRDQDLHLSVNFPPRRGRFLRVPPFHDIPRNLASPRGDAGWNCRRGNFALQTSGVALISSFVATLVLRPSPAASSSRRRDRCHLSYDICFASRRRFHFTVAYSEGSFGPDGITSFVSFSGGHGIRSVDWETFRCKRVRGGWR